MAGWIPPRLRPLLGSDLDALDAEALGRLIGLPEAADLEFKREPYEATEGASKEAAYDLSAMANGGGGLLILGLDQDETGHGSAIWVDASVERHVGLWVHQVVAGRVYPSPQVSHRAVPVPEGVVHVLSVPPSLVRPHAVAAGGGALRFPVRTGTTRRWLSEPEVADAYRRRFSALEAQDARVMTLHKEGANWTPVNEASEAVWLLVACVPDSPGNLELRRGLPDEWREWVDQTLRSFPAPVSRLYGATVGYRSVELHDNLREPQGRPYGVGCRLHLDGSGVAVFGHSGGVGAWGVPNDVSAVYDETLFGHIVNAVGVLARHALYCGCTGDGLLSAQLRPGEMPMALAQGRGNFPGLIEASRRLAEPTAVTRHSTALEAASQPGPDMIAAARLLAADLWSAFGLAEPSQVTRDNELIGGAFSREVQGWMRSWATDAGVTVIG